MIRIEVLCWQDIPVGVKLRGQFITERANLPGRFEQAVQAAAHKSGILHTDDFQYCYNWRQMEPRTGAMQEILDDVLAELDKAYPPSRLSELVARSNGHCRRAVGRMIDPRFTPRF